MLEFLKKFVGKVGDDVLGAAIWEGIKTTSKKWAEEHSDEIAKGLAPELIRKAEIRSKRGLAEGNFTAAAGKLDPPGDPKILEGRINGFLRHLKGVSAELRDIFVYEVGINVPDETARTAFLKTIAEVEDEIDPITANVVKSADVIRQEIAEDRGFLSSDKGLVDKFWDSTKGTLRKIHWADIQTEWVGLRNQINASSFATETVNQSAAALKRAKKRLKRL